jgi:hypothetical protein
VFPAFHLDMKLSARVTFKGISAAHNLGLSTCSTSVGLTIAATASNGMGALFLDHELALLQVAQVYAIVQL